MKRTANEQTFSCRLTAPELRERKATVIAGLKAQVLEKQELPGGYSYKFPGTDEVLDAVTAFVKSERLCCDFLDFRISVARDPFIRLEISGPEGAKAFIAATLGM